MLSFIPLSLASLEQNGFPKNVYSMEEVIYSEEQQPRGYILAWLKSTQDAKLLMLVLQWLLFLFLSLFGKSNQTHTHIYIYILDCCCFLLSCRMRMYFHRKLLKLCDTLCVTEQDFKICLVLFLKYKYLSRGKKWAFWRLHLLGF